MAREEFVTMVKGNQKVEVAKSSYEKVWKEKGWKLEPKTKKSN